MTDTTTTKTRKRRTPEEMIADLQAEIEGVKQRAEARKLKDDPDVQEARKLARVVQKALRGTKDAEWKAALKAAQEAVGGYLEGKGLALPKGRTRRKVG